MVPYGKFVISGTVTQLLGLRVVQTKECSKSLLRAVEEICQDDTWELVNTNTITSDELYGVMYGPSAALFLHHWRVVLVCIREYVGPLPR